MSLIDLEINRNIRKVLVRHWIDLGRLGIHSANGKVTLRGSLTRLPGTKQELDSPTVDTIFREMHRIQNMERLSVHLENWIEAEGSWKKVEIVPTQLPTTNNSGGSTKSFTIG